MKVAGTGRRPTVVSKSKAQGPSGKSGKKASPFADRRVIGLLVVLVGIGGYYLYGWWSEGAARAAARQKLLTNTWAELEKEVPSADALSRLMAGMQRQPDAAMAEDLLMAQAEIELFRGRAERADKLFGAIAASPTASAAQRSLGARILIRKHEGFGGDKVEAKTMLEQVLTMSESAYAETRDVKDLFRAWQAAARLWDARTGDLAGQLRAAHADSPESRLAQLQPVFEPLRDRQTVAELVVDFDKVPDELRAMQTIVTASNEDVAGALKAAELHQLASPGTPCVRIALAFVLHICATGNPEGSADRAAFVSRRNQLLDWLDERAPEDKRVWTKMRALK